MLIFSIAFSSGVIVLYCFGRLPEPGCFPFLLTITFFAFLARLTRPLSFFLLGILYAAMQAEYQIDHQVKLPSSDRAGLNRPRLLQGYVCSLPVQYSNKIVFDFCDVSTVVENSAGDSKTGDRYSKLRLSFYLPDEGARNSVNRANSARFQGVLTLYAKLKPPNGVVNKHGFSYETWLFAHGYSGTGYVLSSLSAAKSACGISCRYWLWRNSLVSRFANFSENQNEVNKHEGDYLGFFHSIVMGNKSAISAEAKQLFNETGVGHLLVISGLHIGFIGFLAVKLSRFLLARLFPNRRPGVVRAAALIAILPVFAYTAIAGFTVPTTRACLMFLFGSLMFVILCRPIIWVFCVTFSIVLVIQPSSVLDGGFWLSFYAVFLLLLTHSARPIPSPWPVRLCKPHVVLFLGLAPLMLLLGMKVSLVSVLANGLVVPFFGAVMLPLGFLAGVVSFMDESVYEFVLFLFAMGYRLIIGYLSYLHQFDLFLSIAGFTGPLQLLVILVLVLWLILPLPLKIRCLAAGILLAFCCYPIDSVKQDHGIIVYDVGQGLSVELHDKTVRMVYDYGVRYSDTYDIATLVLLPGLQARGLTSIDFSVISHWDLDHSGGWQTFIRNIGVDTLLSSKPSTAEASELLRRESNRSRLSEYCYSGVEYRKKQFLFRALWPEPGADVAGNNASCVIKVEIAGVSVLIPGDIEKEVEFALVRRYGKELRSDVLIVPHHGSQTSSTWAFLKHVRPKIAIISSGYMNKFGHPHKDVLQRLQYFGAATYNTAESGAVHLSWNGEKSLKNVKTSPWKVQETRKVYNKFWLRE